MLCFKVKVGEKVYVGEVVVTVLSTSKGLVRLGFAGPPNVIIDRQSVREDKVYRQELKRREGGES